MTPTFPMLGELAMNLEAAKRGSKYLTGGLSPFGAHEGGVATVSIHGALEQRGMAFAGMMLFDGHEAIAQRVAEALALPTVRGVLLDIDSPGGVVGGLFEALTATRLAKARAKKPVVAMVNELAASAAYGWASVADRIVLPRSGSVGSVGVLSVLSSITRALDQGGVDVAVIRSGERKAEGHPALPLDKETLRSTQARVDRLASQFAEVVAQGRRASASRLLELKGALFDGDEAVERGLADRVGGREVAMSELKKMMDGGVGVGAGTGKVTMFDVGGTTFMASGSMRDTPEYQAILAEERAKIRARIDDTAAATERFEAASADFTSRSVDFGAMSPDQKARWRKEVGEATYQRAKEAWEAAGSPKGAAKERYEDMTVDERVRLRKAPGGEARYLKLRQSWERRGRPR